MSVNDFLHATMAAMRSYAATPAAFYAYVALAVVGALSLGTLVLPWLLQFITHRPQDLKKKYGASWALVTGGSSGIGRSLVHKLAKQGLNVVVAAVPDALLEKTGAEFKAAYPHLAFRIVPVNLGATEPSEYMEPLIAATADIDVQLIFNNAGYMVTGFFDAQPLGKWLANYNCNSSAPISITHHFVTKMKAAGLKGCVVFTSSPANIIPSPFSCMYGATKAFITHLATSLAGELHPEGIDVAVVHPSPVATAFYTGAHAMPTLQMFKNTATGPDVVAETTIRGIGRNVIIDQGYYPFVLRLMLRLIELTTLVDLLQVLAATTGDYKVLKAAGSAIPAAPVAAPVSSKSGAAATPSRDAPTPRKRAGSAGRR